MSKISEAEFKQRLAALCLGRSGRGLPRKRRDQHILLKSIILTLEPDRDYTESELNEALIKWLVDIGQAVELDHVTLRRHLVDEGYLSRDRAGMSYTVCREENVDFFEPATNALNPTIVIQQALVRKEQRKRQHLDKTSRRPLDRP